MNGVVAVRHEGGEEAGHHGGGGAGVGLALANSS